MIGLRITSFHGIGRGIPYLSESTGNLYSHTLFTHVIFRSYLSLLEQFEAVSYGDDLFAAVVLLPLVQTCNVKYKLALWSQHRDSLRVITLKQEQVRLQKFIWFINNCRGLQFFSVCFYLQTILPYRVYFTPAERSFELLKAYVRAIAAGCCRNDRNPFLYRLAVHHVASFIFQQVNV